MMIISHEDRSRWFSAALLAAAMAVLGAAGAMAATSGDTAHIPFGLNGVPNQEAAEDGALADEFQLSFFTKIFQWLEPEPGAYFWKDTGKGDRFKEHLVRLKAKGYSVSLTNTTVHMDQKHVPKYLAGKRLNDPEFLDRWEAFLRAFLAQYGDVVDYLNLGNEVGSYFGGHMDEWPDFVEFVKRARKVVREVKPSIEIGVVLASNDSAAFWPDIEPFCDYSATTYYTPCSAFSKSPTSEALEPSHAKYFAKSLDGAIRNAGGKPLLITEIGCATHEQIDSSPELQVKFIEQLFQWMRGKEEQVLGISWLSHIDWPYEGTKTALQGFLDSAALDHEPFMRYLTSLGLMYEDGSKKPGYDALKQALASYRGQDVAPAGPTSAPDPGLKDILSNGGFELGNLSEAANNAVGSYPWFTSNRGGNAISATGRKARGGKFSLAWEPVGWNVKDDGTSEDASTFIITKLGRPLSSGAKAARFSGAVDTSALDPKFSVLAILANGTFTNAKFDTVLAGGRDGWQTFETSLPLEASDETLFVAFTVIGTKGVGAPGGAVHIDDLVLAFDGG